MRKLLLLCCLILPLSSFGQYSALQTSSYTAAANSAIVLNIGTGITVHKITWTVSGGTLSGCSVKLQQSAALAFTSPSDLIAGQTCTSNGSSSVTAGTANYTRVSVTTLTVATGTPILTVTWTGYLNTVAAGDSIEVADVTITGLTAGQVVFPDASKQLTGSSRFSWNDSAGGLEVTAPAATSGQGILFFQPSALTTTVATAGALSLIELSSHNTDAVSANSQLYDMYIATDTDALDTGAGLAIINSGMSDNIYLSVAGKAGVTASTPTGIGVDINRSGSGENSTVNAGTGIHVWDFSSTDQGESGPTGIYLKKQNNKSSAHHLMHFENVNKNAIVIKEGTSPTAADGIITLNTSAGANLWTFNANGDLNFAAAKGLYFNMTSGNQGYMIGSGTNLLLRGGSSGGGIRNTADSATLITWNDSGQLAVESLVVNGGTAITGHLSAAAVLDFGNLAAIGCEDLTITVTGAAVGDTVAIGVPNGSVPSATFTYTAWVSATNTVTIRGCTLVSGDPASGTFRADVWQH